MDESLKLAASELRDTALEIRVGHPLPQISDPERAFWRRAVELERRRMEARHFSKRA